MQNKLSIFLMLMLIINPLVLGATKERYVNTGSSGGDGTTNAVSGATAAFASLALFESTEDGQSDVNDVYNVHLNRTNGGGVDTAVLFSGFAAGVVINLIQDDFPADGIFDDTKYIISDVNETVVKIEGHINISALQIKSTVTGTGGGCGIRAPNTSSIPAGTAFTWDRVIIIGVSSGTGINYGILFQDTDSSLTLTNSVVDGFLSGADTGFGGINIGGGTANIYASISTGNYYGVTRNGGTVTVTNCVSFNNTDDWNGTMTVTYSASDDTQTGTGNIDWTSEATDWAANFKSYTTGDYTPVLDSSIYHTGSDLDLTLDLAGHAWHATTPSIGAFEYYVETPPALTGKARIYIIN